MNNYIYVVTYNNKIIATAKLYIETKFFDSIGHIEDVVVDVQYRYMNIGKKLIKFVTNVALSSFKCYKVVLNAKSSLSGFYNKCDYHVDELNVSCTYRLQNN